MVLKVLDNIQVVLGSKSPRRKELLERLGIDFQIVVFETDEIIDFNLTHKDIVIDIAQKKLARFVGNEFFESLVIAADTVVVHQGTILGKPRDADNAFDVLKSLQGNKHIVYTAVAVAYHGKTHSFVEETIVEFYPLSDEEIHHYINYHLPLDKAGAYGIQDWIGLIGIKGIEGSYENVVGLPTARLYQELKKILF